MTACPQECKKLGLQGASVRAELTRLTQEELPQHFEAIVERLRGEQFEAAPRCACLVAKAFVVGGRQGGWCRDMRRPSGSI